METKTTLSEEGASKERRRFTRWWEQIQAQAKVYSYKRKRQTKTGLTAPANFDG